MPCTMSCAEPLFLEELVLAGVLVFVGVAIWGADCRDLGGIVESVGCWELAVVRGWRKEGGQGVLWWIEWLEVLWCLSWRA